MPPPIVCIDCAPLIVRSAGVKTYLYHWVNALRDLNPNAIRTFLAPDGPELHHEGGFRLHPRQIGTLLALNMLRSFGGGIMAPRCDMFHASNLLRNIPRRPRLTATIHDLTTWILPEYHTPGNVAADRAFAERVLKRARGLIAVSENTRQDAIRVLGLAAEKIQVIHHGVPRRYRSVPPDAVARVRAAFSLNKPYYLSVGTIEPRKNIDALLTAWQSLPAPFRGEYDLVVAGAPGWSNDTTMQKLLQLSGEGAGIRYLGYVPESDLPALTAGASAFVYPSFYEGFGIPVAQAMAAGCPVITSNVSSLPEVTGGAAILIDPRSVAELGAAMRRVGESADLRSQLAAAGRARAKLYTWEAAAARSPGVLRFSCVETISRELWRQGRFSKY